MATSLGDNVNVKTLERKDRQVWLMTSNPYFGTISGDQTEIIARMITFMSELQLVLLNFAEFQG